jgi:hypothetical protein
MDVEDAFTQEAITALGTDVSGDLEDEVRTMVQRIFTTNELVLPEDLARSVENVAVLFFVAGRTYESDSSNEKDPIQLLVDTYPDVASALIRFLVQRGEV